MTTRGSQVRSAIGADPSGALVRPDGDLYRSHPIITSSLLKVEAFPGTTWEPACGLGDMSEVLIEGRLRVISTDVINHGYGGVRDFLQDEPPVDVTNVITNPPFSLAEEFAHRALAVVPRNGKVALLYRLAWLEGSGRHRRLFSSMPPTRIWVFSKRVAMARGYEAEFQTGLIPFCWVVWEINNIGRTELGWI